MRVRLDRRVRPPGLDDLVLVHLDLPALGSPLTMSCSVVYLERLGSRLECGLHFLPLLHPEADARRAAALRGYLQTEQRRRRKAHRASKPRLRVFTGEEVGQFGVAH